MTKDFLEKLATANETECRKLIVNFVVNLRQKRMLSQSRAVLEKMREELERRAEIPTIRGESIHTPVFKKAGVSFDVRQNPELLGGAKIETRGRSVDASVRGRLQKLSSYLQK